MSFARYGRGRGGCSLFGGFIGRADGRQAHAGAGGCSHGQRVVEAQGVAGVVDVLFFLFSFVSSQLKHVKIGLMGASKQRDKEHEETTKKVTGPTQGGAVHRCLTRTRQILEERKINIDATVVRIMKSRKEMSHKGMCAS